MMNNTLTYIAENKCSSQLTHELLMHVTEVVHTIILQTEQKHGVMLLAKRKEERFSIDIFSFEQTVLGY